MRMVNSSASKSMSSFPPAGTHSQFKMSTTRLFSSSFLSASGSRSADGTWQRCQT